MTRDTLTGTQSGLWAPSLSWEGMGGQSQRERGRRYPPQQTHLLKMGTAHWVPSAQPTREHGTAEDARGPGDTRRRGAAAGRDGTARPCRDGWGSPRIGAAVTTIAGGGDAKGIVGHTRHDRRI